MTPRTLWAVWTQTRPLFVKAGVADPVSQGWALASEGEAGLEEIRQSVSRGFLAALSLADIGKAWEAMGSVEQGLMGKAAARWLPFARSTYVVLVQDSTGALVWTPLRASSDEEAAFAAAQFGRVIAVGQADDLKNTFEQGTQILLDKNYSQVLIDVRPITPDHPRGWLLGKQAPHLAADIARLNEESHAA